LHRIAPLAAAVVLALGLATASPARESGLPDMGSSAGELITPQQEADYGAYTLYELRRYGYLLEDPLIDSWLLGMGQRLGAASDKPKQEYTFFVMRDRQINAFATLGGYIGVNAGLILTAEREDEVAGVLAHEISHVTQQHVLRSVERARRDQLPIMLAMLGAIVAARSSNSSSSDDAIAAAVVGSQALAAQRQINYTRSNEAEADRVGIQTLQRSGFDVDGMADFFERMDRVGRGNSGGYQAPDYLRSHPVTTTRISEARERADRLRSAPAAANTAAAAPISPLLPASLMLGGNGSAGAARPASDGLFEWARERLRVLSAASPQAAIREYQLLAVKPASNPARRYGLALAQLQAGYPAAAEAALQELSKQGTGQLWLRLALAETAKAAKDETLARQRYEALLRDYPQNRAISLSYAQMLNGSGSRSDGQRAQAVMRPLLNQSGYDPLFQKTFGRASELAGDLPRAGEAYAEVAYLNGRAEDALKQLSELLKRPDVDYVQRARIEARIAEITPEALEMRRQGLKPSDQPADRG
jgi:predicted Zn-dependent protease